MENKLKEGDWVIRIRSDNDKVIKGALYKIVYIDNWDVKLEGIEGIYGYEYFRKATELEIPAEFQVKPEIYTIY